MLITTRIVIIVIMVVIISIMLITRRIVIIVVMVVIISIMTYLGSGFRGGVRWQEQPWTTDIMMATIHSTAGTLFDAHLSVGCPC